MRVLALVTAALALFPGLRAGDWSEASAATGPDGSTLVTCRSRLAGGYLVVELEAAEGWHVYAMDNERRAKEALAGRMSLGVEQDTEVVVEGGLRVAGDWYQTEPTDFSQPELRWYSYGFEGTSLLAARTEVVPGGRSARITVSAQACDSGSCLAVEAAMELPVGSGGDSAFDPAGLVRVDRQ